MSLWDISSRFRRIGGPLFVGECQQHSRYGFDPASGCPSCRHYSMKLFPWVTLTHGTPDYGSFALAVQRDRIVRDPSVQEGYANSYQLFARVDGVSEEQAGEIADVYMRHASAVVQIDGVRGIAVKAHVIDGHSRWFIASDSPLGRAVRVAAREWPADWLRDDWRGRLSVPDLPMGFLRFFWRDRAHIALLGAIAVLGEVPFDDEARAMAYYRRARQWWQRNVRPTA